jgi:transposase-like protein
MFCSEPSGKAAAPRFCEKAMAQNGSPEPETIDKSGSALAAFHVINGKRETPIMVRHVKYLNNIVEQDHRAINASLGQCRGSRTLTARAFFSVALRLCT